MFRDSITKQDANNRDCRIVEVGQIDMMKLGGALKFLFVKALIIGGRSKNYVYKSFMVVYIDYKFAFFSMSHGKINYGNTDTCRLSTLITMNKFLLPAVCSMR